MISIYSVMMDGLLKYTISTCHSCVFKTSPCCLQKETRVLALTMHNTFEKHEYIHRDVRHPRLSMNASLVYNPSCLSIAMEAALELCRRRVGIYFDT
jgi:hypothetical protein